MKKFIVSIFCIGLIGSAVLPALAGCINNNWHPLVDGVEMTEICCVFVGDGTAASCTDGDVWILIDEDIEEL